ncbi:hypothetical protein [Methanopyrus kandleri]
MQEMEYEGRVHPSEEVIESWVEAGFEVRVVGREKFEEKCVHFKACYTDNVMAITSANMTTAGLERLRECSELVVPLVMDVKAPVALLEYEPRSRRWSVRTYTRAYSTSSSRHPIGCTMAAYPSTRV